MSKKDYELIADAIHSYIEEGGGVNKAVEAIGLALAGDNPLFDMEKFEDRCWWGKEGRPKIAKLTSKRRVVKGTEDSGE